MTTPRLGLPLPEGADQITTLTTGPHDIREIAQTLDDAAMFGQSVHSSRPSPSLAGRLWLSTDTGQVSIDTGSAWVELARTSVASTPPGVVMWTGASAAPGGWLLADGTAVSRSTHAALFAAIGTTYGAGDGSTTFNLPDLRGRVPVGAGSAAGLTSRTRGQTFGYETVLLTAAQSGLRSHGHGRGTLAVGGQINVNPSYPGKTFPAGTGWVIQPAQSGTGISAVTASFGFDGGLAAVWYHEHTLDGQPADVTAANAQSAHDNTQPSLVLTPIIKT